MLYIRKQIQYSKMLLNNSRFEASFFFQSIRNNFSSQKTARLYNHY